MTTATAQKNYSVSKNSQGKKEINFGCAYLPSVNYAEITQAVHEEFLNISPEKLMIKIEGTAWYYGGGSFRIVVREI